MLKTRLPATIILGLYWRLHCVVKKKLESLKQVSFFKTEIIARSAVDNFILACVNTYFIYVLVIAPDFLTALLCLYCNALAISHTLINVFNSINHRNYATVYQTTDVSMTSKVISKVLPIADNQITTMGRVNLKNTAINQRIPIQNHKAQLSIIVEDQKVYMHDFAAKMLEGGENIRIGNAGFITSENGLLYGCSHILKNPRKLYQRIGLRYTTVKTC